MSDSPFQLVVGPIEDWPDDHVQRAYKLLTGTVRRLHLQPLGARDDAGLHRAEGEAAMYGFELIRRGLL
jgi:hypothetical protein